MPKISNIVWSVLIAVVFIVLGCWYLFTRPASTNNTQSNTQIIVPSSNKLINSFVFAGLNPEANGAIDNTNFAINLLVPTGTDLTKLTPTISISDKATVSPDTGKTKDFSKPITYTVTAQDGSTQSYIVTVTTGTISQDTNTTSIQSSDKQITSFVLAGLNPVITGTINTSGNSVNLIVPGNTDITNLVPTITISDGATIFPSSGIAENFTNPIVYTVTAEDGSIQDYTVTVIAQTTQ